MVWPAIMAAAIPAIGGIFQNERQISSARETSDFNAEQAAINRQFNAREAELARQFGRASQERSMDFAERMSNTAAERGVAGLRRAGLNPILAATRGMGASTPTAPAPSGTAASGSTAQGVMPKLENVLKDSVSSAVAMAKGLPEAKRIKQDTANLEAAERLTKEKHQTEKLLQGEVAARTASHTANTANTVRATQLMEDRAEHLRATAAAARSSSARTNVGTELDKTKLPGARIEQEIDESIYGELLRWIRRLNPFASSAKTAAQGAGAAARGVGAYKRGNSLRQIERRLSNMPTTKR